MTQDPTLPQSCDPSLGSPSLGPASFEQAASLFPVYSRTEWLADLAVHITGLTLAVIGVPILLILGLPGSDGATIISLTLYALGLLAMLSFSASYNIVRNAQVKERLRRCDHAAIFLMIAGTYTPFVLLKIGGVWGLSLFGIVWLLGIIGIAIAFLFPRRADRAIVVLCLLMGWSIISAINPLIDALTSQEFVLLAVGAIVYTAGVGFHLWERLPYHNAIWHLCVLVAAACHYAAVLDAVVLS